MIKKEIFALGFIFFLLITLNSCFKGDKVDLIIHNARVHTMNQSNDIAEALAVHNGKIVEVGPEREILNRYRAVKTINARKKDVFPGFHDGHSHILSLAKQKLSADLTGSGSYYEMLLKLEKFQSKNELDFLTGRGWDQSLWDDNELPTNELLNERFPDIPVALTRVDGHAMLINDTLLKLSGLDTIQTIKGGEVIFENNKPTGLILDNAIEIISKLTPAPEKSLLKDKIKEVENELLAYGITQIHEAGIHHKELELLIEMYDNNKLNINIYGMLFPTKENMSFVEENGHYRNSNFSVRSFKILLDGALGSRGACLLHPYNDAENKFGLRLVNDEELDEIAEFAIHHDYQLNAHCIGDSANRVLLNLMKNKLEGKADHRWRVEHAQVIHPEDIKLFNEVGAIPSVQPTHATSDYRWAEKRLGLERLNSSAYKYKTLFDARNMIVLGTDFPVEDIDPFATIHAAVQRKDRENAPENGFLTEEALSLRETLQGMTLWASYGSFDESNSGTLEKGKKANLAIFDYPVKSEPKYKANYAIYTIIDGKVVYSMDL